MAHDKRKDSNQRDRHRAPGTSRRQFLKSGAVVGAGGAATLAGLGARAPQAAQADAIRWDREVDVVVIGAGAAGLPAAIAARDGGASVLVVEQHFDIGGIAIMSGGNIHIGGGNRLQKKKGIEDSADLVFADWTRPDHDEAKFNDRALVRKFADENVRDVRVLERERPRLGRRPCHRAGWRVDGAASGETARMADPRRAGRVRSGEKRIRHRQSTGAQRPAKGCRVSPVAPDVQPRPGRHGARTGARHDPRRGRPGL